VTAVKNHFHSYAYLQKAAVFKKTGRKNYIGVPVTFVDFHIGPKYAIHFRTFSPEVF
jgi:hypothetical protein